MKAINLLPPDLRGTPKRSGGASSKPSVAPEAPAGIGAYVVLGALAACVLALAAYVLTTNTVKDRQAKLEATNAQAAATTQRVAQLKPYADFKAMAETRIQTVKDLASSRFDWEQSLRDVSRAIPANVTLKTLTGTMSSGTTGGGSSIRGQIAAPAIELTGCTKSQKDVATLLSRMRGVDGVTRVSLGKSLKPAAADEGAVSGAVTEDDGCGTGRPPAFEVVMFFERSKVPASVQDITVAPAGDSQPAAAAAGEQGAGSTQPQANVTTPPADPAEAGAATPAATPQGGGS